MPPRETISGAESCSLAARWGLSNLLTSRLILAAIQFEQETRRPVELISGSRTRAEQAALGRSGRPAAPDNVSTHRSCPATGADVSLGFGVTRVMKATWGRIAVMNGLRWGGGGPVDDGGIPLDWAHVDLGPRE